jgi:hypothetical protein
MYVEEKIIQKEHSIVGPEVSKIDIKKEFSGVPQKLFRNILPVKSKNPILYDREPCFDYVNCSGLDIKSYDCEKLKFMNCSIKGKLVCHKKVRYVEFDGSSYFMLKEIRGEGIKGIRSEENSLGWQMWTREVVEDVNIENTINHEISLYCKKLEHFYLAKLMDVLTIILYGVEAKQVIISAPNCKKIVITCHDCNPNIKFLFNDGNLIFGLNRSLRMNHMNCVKNKDGGYDLYFNGEGVSDISITEEIKSIGSIHSITIENAPLVYISHCLECTDMCNFMKFGPELKTVSISNVERLVLHANIDLCEKWTFKNIGEIYRKLYSDNDQDIPSERFECNSLKEVTIDESKIYHCNVLGDKGLTIKSANMKNIRMNEVSFGNVNRWILVNINGDIYVVLDAGLVNKSILRLESSKNQDVNVELGKIRVSGLSLSSFGKLNVTNDSGSELQLVKLRDIEELFLNGKFNVSKPDVIDVYIVNCPKFAGDFSISGLYMNVPVDNDYLYRVLLREFNITKKVFPLFSNWLKAQKFTNVHELFNVIVGYFGEKYSDINIESLRKNIVSNLIIDKSCTRFLGVTKLSLKQEVSPLYLFDVFSNIDLFSNLVELKCITNLHISASEFGYIIAPMDKLRLCEVRILNNINSLKCNLPNLTLVVYLSGAFDFTDVHRIRVYAIGLVSSSLCNVFEYCKVFCPSNARGFGFLCTRGSSLNLKSLKKQQFSNDYFPSCRNNIVFDNRVIRAPYFIDLYCNSSYPHENNNRFTNWYSDMYKHLNKFIESHEYNIKFSVITVETGVYPF